MEKIKLGPLTDTIILDFYEWHEFPIISCTHNKNKNCMCKLCKLFLESYANKLTQDYKLR